MTIIYVILGVAFCLYGLAVRAVGSGTSFFLIWMMTGFLAFLYAIAKKNAFWKTVPQVLRLTSFTVFGMALLLFIFVEGLILSHFREQGEEKLDCIIVLGAQIYDSGPSVVLQYRLDKAAEYLKENPETLCIVSGGKGYNEPYAEAQGMRGYLVTHGIPEERILLEDRALNTVQNIACSSELLERQGVDLRKMRVGIVTNNFHVYRGTAIAKNQDFEHVCGIAAGSDPFFLVNNLLREFCGVCKDKLFGNL
ncbi:MAG: YdcF family protein [Lachnospiraceae bacterium]|nr:YdcF family protein [Lachnospiraceae bacterium]